jgi:hypothetical protein
MERDYMYLGIWCIHSFEGSMVPGNQGDQKILRKSRPKCSQRRFLSKFMHNCVCITVEKSRMLATSEKNCP